MLAGEGMTFRPAVMAEPPKPTLVLRIYWLSFASGERGGGEKKAALRTIHSSGFNGSIYASRFMARIGEKSIDFAIASSIHTHTKKTVDWPITATMLVRQTPRRRRRIVAAVATPCWSRERETLSGELCSALLWLDVA